MPSTPSLLMAAGVLAMGKSLRVAALTLLSVVWAESMTAASNSNAVLYSSSVVGLGFAACNRRKIARRRAGVMAEAPEQRACGQPARRRVPRLGEPVARCGPD